MGKRGSRVFKEPVLIKMFFADISNGSTKISS